jgi:hypothetical protein
MTTVSSSVTAGEQIQLNAGAVKAAEYNSPSRPGKEEDAGKKAMKLGEFLETVSNMPRELDL